MKRDHVSICVCTFKRPRLLDRLLRELERLDTQNLFSFSVVVVDNDSQPTGRKVIEDIRSGVSFPVEYYHVPERSISLARNMAVRNAKGNFIAFIDDDEFPERDWIRNLYEAIKKYRCDGVLGPVIPHYENEAPGWLVKSRLAERKRFRTGQIMNYGDTRTGNTLLRRELFNDVEEWFDKKFGKSGGSDVVFFKRMIEKGKTFVWCDEAVVHETVPVERQEKIYYLKRALVRGVGNSWLYPMISVSTLKSLAAVMIYSLSLPFFFIAGQHLFIRYLVKDCDHLGKLLAYLHINIVQERPYKKAD